MAYSKSNQNFKEYRNSKEFPTFKIFFEIGFYQNNSAMFWVAFTKPFTNVRFQLNVVLITKDKNYKNHVIHVGNQYYMTIVCN